MPAPDAPLPPEISLRPATAEDSAFVFDVIHAAFREYVELVVGWDEPEQRRIHARRFASQDVRIIERSGAAVGFVATDREPDGVRVQQLHVLPEHQSCGAGGACLRRVQEEARRHGLPVRLRVLRVDPRALAFYLRHGFVESGTTATHHLLVLPA